MSWNNQGRNIKSDLRLTGHEENTACSENIDRTDNKKGLAMKKRGVSRRRKYNLMPRRMLALLCSVMMIFSTIPGSMLASYADGTKSSGQLTLVPNVASAEIGNEISVKVTAVAENDRKFTTFVLNTKSDGAGLSDDYDFDDENKTEINTLDDNKLTLHRETRTDGQYLYFFTLARGEKAAFSLVCMDSPDHSVKGTPLTEEEEKLYEAELSAERNTSDFAISINASSSDAEKTADTETASVSDAEKTAAATTSGSASTNKTVTETASQSNATVTGTTETTGDDGALPDGEVTNTSGTEAGETAAETQETVNTLEFTFASGATIQQAEKEISTTLEKASGSNASKADSVRCSISWYEIISGSLKDFEDGLQATIYTDSSYMTEGDDDAEITVSGRMPENAVIKAYPVDVTIDGVAVLASYDITIFDSAKENAHKFQPLSDYPVDVSISSAAIEASESVSVYHIADDDIGKEMSSDTAADTETKEKASATVSKETAVATKVASFEPANEEVKFAAESFSIYAVTDDKVSGLTDLKGAYDYLVQGDSGTFTVYFAPNETNKTITLLHRPGDKIDQGVKNETGDTSKNGTWSIEAGEAGVQDFSSENQKFYTDTSTEDGSTKSVSLIAVKLINPLSQTAQGAPVYKVTIQYSKKQPGTTGKLTSTITLNLVALSSPYIEDKIANTDTFAGCLGVDVTGYINEDNADATHTYKYVWQRRATSTDNWENVDTTTGTVNDPNSPDNKYTIKDADDTVHKYSVINVAVDSAVNNTANARLYYHLQIIKIPGTDNNPIFSNDYQIPYYRTLQNTSFETPVVTGHNQFPNGTEGLYWKTTGVGKGAMESQDVEIPKYSNNGYDNDYMANGHVKPDASDDSNKQYAELNAEAAGALYQDLITAPGATLSWSFAHRMRVTSDEYRDYDIDNYTDTMYVVAVATECAKEQCITQDQIDKITAESGAQTNGASVTVQIKNNNKTYQACIWKVSDPAEWVSHSGTYIVPSKQYLTRIFLASGTTFYDTVHGSTGSYKYTVGNLLDNVAASQRMSYTINYFLKNDKTGEDELNTTQTGTTNPNTWVTAKIPSELSQYALSRVENGIVSGNDIKMFVRDGNIVMNLYYVKKGISATKVVQFETDNLTEKERTAINTSLGTSGKAYKIYYSLKNKTSGAVVAYATLSINSIDIATGTGSNTTVFTTTKDGSVTFIPDANTDYTVSEDDAVNVPAGCIFDRSEVNPDIRSSDYHTGAVQFKNYYKKKPQTVTVAKRVAGDFADLTQKFKFTLTVKKSDGTPYTEEISQNITKNSDNATTGNYSFVLSNNKSVQIPLPEGVKYSIVEDTYDGYSTVVAVGTGAPLVGNTTGEQTLTTDTNITYTNTALTEKLTVQKAVTGGMGDTKKLFGFTVSLYSDKVDGTPYTGKIILPGQTTKSDSTGSFTVQLTGSSPDNVKVCELPYGVYYKVTETPASGYTPTWTDGKYSGQLITDTTVTCTNNRDAAVPNGLNRDIVQYLIMLLAGLLATWVLVIHRRKREWQ